MKKITYEQACKRLEERKVVKCRISSREYIVIKDKNELDQKRLLSEQGVQQFELYKEHEDNDIPGNAMKITIDEAYELLSKLELIYCKKDGEEEEVITRTELNRIIMSSNIRGEEPLLYWYV